MTIKKVLLKPIFPLKLISSRINNQFQFVTPPVPPVVELSDLRACLHSQRTSSACTVVQRNPQSNSNQSSSVLLDLWKPNLLHYHYYHHYHCHHYHFHNRSLLAVLGLPTPPSRQEILPLRSRMESVCVERCIAPRRVRNHHA